MTVIDQRLPVRIVDGSDPRGEHPVAEDVEQAANEQEPAPDQTEHRELTVALNELRAELMEQIEDRTVELQAGQADLSAQVDTLTELMKVSCPPTSAWR